jgi:hypothetical protein
MQVIGQLDTKFVVCKREHRLYILDQVCTIDIYLSKALLSSLLCADSLLWWPSTVSCLLTPRISLLVFRLLPSSMLSTNVFVWRRLKIKYLGSLESKGMWNSPMYRRIFRCPPTLLRVLVLLVSSAVFPCCCCCCCCCCCFHSFTHTHTHTLSLSFSPLLTHTLSLSVSSL